MEFFTSTRRAEPRAVEGEVEVEVEAGGIEAEAGGGGDVMMLSRSWVMRDMTASANVSVLSWRWCASRRRRAKVDERHWLTGSVEAVWSPLVLVDVCFPESYTTNERRSRSRRKEKKKKKGQEREGV